MVMFYCVAVFVFQLQSLMEDKRVVEALELVKNSTHMGMTSEKVDQVWVFFYSLHRMSTIVFCICLFVELFFTLACQYLVMYACSYC